MVHGVQVERATVRTTWTPWAASARLCLGRRWTGWELPRTPLRTRSRERCPLHPGAGRSPPVAARQRAGESWDDGGYVFATRNGRPVEPRNVYRSFTRVAQSAGLRVIRLHDARHGCATLLTAAGVAPRVVMEILGHSQISITMDVYTHVVQDTQREAISHMDRLLKRRPVVSDRPR